MIKHVVLNHFVSCNLRCIHCGYINQAYKDTKHEDVLRVIKRLTDRGIISPSATYDIGGGEPSIQRGLDDIMQYLIQCRHKTHLNSNGTNYVELYSKGVNMGLISLTLTPDAGSNSVYLATKGADFCDTVWENIRRYVEATDGKAEVKIILEEGNIGDTDNMLERLVKSNTRRFCIDVDIGLPADKQGAFAEPFLRFKESCRQAGIQTRIGPHVPDVIRFAARDLP